MGLGVVAVSTGRRVTASLVVVGALLSSCAGDLEVVAVLPAGVEETLPEGGILEVVAVDELGNDRTETTPWGQQVELPDMSEGRWTFTLAFVDASGRRVLEGRSVGVDVARGRHPSISVVLAPLESIVELPTSDPDAESVARRHGLSAVTFEGADGRPRVLLSGGSVDGDERAEAWVYRPEEIDFRAVGELRCPRSGHGALAVRLLRRRTVILVAGGGDAPCRDGSGRTAADVVEIYDPEDRRFIELDLALSSPDGSGPPDLSGAVLALFSENEVFLAGDGAAWILDLERPPRLMARPLEVRGTMPGAGRVAVPLTPELERAELAGRVALMGGAGTSTEIQVFSPDRDCGALRFEDLPEAGHQATYVPTKRVLVTHGDSYHRLEFDCPAIGSVASGALDPPRRGHAAAELEDGRILLVGGEEGDAGTTTLFLATTSSPVYYPGPATAHAGTGHAVAALPDGTALIVGGSRPAELWNPDRRRRELTDALAMGSSRPEPDDELRIVLVVDGTEEGEALRQALAPEAWRLAPQDPRSDIDRLGQGIGVLSTNAGSGGFDDVPSCGPGLAPGWVVSSSEPEEPPAGPFVDPRLSTIAEVLEWRVRAAGATGVDGAACPVNQPLAVILMVLLQLAEATGDYHEALGEAPGGILFVVVAATDDCSGGSSAGGPFDPAACGDAEGRVDPEDLAAWIAESPLDETRIEVAVIGGELDGEGDCVLPERLGRAVSSLGGRGTSAPACAGPDLEAAVAEAVDAAAERAAMLAFRRVCVAPQYEGDSLECDVLEVRRVEPDEGLLRLEEGTDWLFVPNAPECDHVDAGETHALRMSTAYPHGDVGTGRFVRFDYVCW